MAGGLRERKKERTRARLSEAAWLLAAEHGVQAVTVEEIAQRADVSPRTFFNYFSTKEEAILDRSRSFALGLVEGIRARPSAEPLPAAIAAAGGGLIEELSTLPDGWLRRLRTLREENPELIPHQVALHETIVRSLAEVIAERTETDPERDVYPELVARCVLTCWQVAFSHWEESDSATALKRRWLAALNQLAAGIAEPVHPG